jgi:hypothetical protein
MEQDLAKQVQKRLAELPEDVRKAVQSAELEKKIQDIGKKNVLHIDQAADLEDETLLVMLGFNDPAELSKKIMERLNLDDARSKKIATDITEEIFLPIRESMKKFTKQRAKEEPIISGVKAPPAQVSLPAIPKSPGVPAVPMPEASVAAKPPTPPAPKAPTPAPVPPPAAPKPPVVSAADLALTQKTVSAPKPAPTAATTPASAPAAPGAGKPVPYKADPYREPPE